MGYCARANVYATGLPPEAFARPARLIEGVLPTTGLLALRSHGLAPDAPLTLSIQSASTFGAQPAALPAGLLLGTTYYARPMGSDLLALAPAPSPALAIATFGDAGAGVIGIVVDHGPYLDAAIDAATAVVDQYARAHAAPIAAAVLPFVTAFLAARIYVVTHAAANPEYAERAEAPSWIRTLVDKLFGVYLEGSPILGAVDATPSIPEEGALTVPLAPREFDLSPSEVFRA